MQPSRFIFAAICLTATTATGTRSRAWAAGGWLGYQTGWIGDVLQFGVVGYTSLPVWAPEDRDGTLLLIGQEGFAVLGQAYAALKFEEQVATFYRQLVNQPEVNPQDNRMVPNTFEGATLKGDLGPVSYYGGVLTAMKKRDADEFVNIAEAAGVAQNELMYLGGLDVRADRQLGGAHLPLCGAEPAGVILQRRRLDAWRPPKTPSSGSPASS